MFRVRYEALVTLNTVIVFLGLPVASNILIGSPEFRAIEN